MSIFVKTCVAAAVMAVAGLAQAAPVSAFTLTSRAGTLGLSGWTVGWSFNLNKDVTVTSVGFTTDTGLPSAVDNKVSIWKADGTFVLSGTVPAGTAVVDSFSWTDVSVPTQLTAGNYVIGALIPDGHFQQNAAGTFSSEVTWTSGRFYSGADAFPNNGGGDVLAAGVYQYFGPNFQYSVPEPTSLGLLGTGALLVMRRRRAQ